MDASFGIECQGSVTHIELLETLLPVRKMKNLSERLINHLKQFRRIATRYEKRAANFSDVITTTSIFLPSDSAYRH